MLRSLRNLLQRLFCCGSDAANPEVAGCEVIIDKVAAAHKPSPPAPCTPPEIFVKQYHKVIDHDITAAQAVCLTSDIAVLGNADLSGGDTCITGNVLVAGNVSIKGSPCVTGTVIILGSAHVEGQACMTGDCFVHGDLAVKGKLDVGGKLCVFGSKDIQPAQ